MPLYDFICNECGAKFEDIVKHVNSDQMQQCPECGKIAAVKVNKPQKFAYSLNRPFSRMRTGV